MRASTSRTLTTVFTLGIAGLGAWWAWNNVLPVIASGLRKTTPTPTTPTPTQPTGTPGIDSSFISDAAKALSDALSLAFRNGFSGTGTKVLLDEANDGVPPSSGAWHYVSPTNKNMSPAELLAYWRAQLAKRPADLGGYVPWSGQNTGYYSPDNWRKDNIPTVIM